MELQHLPESISLQEQDWLLIQDASSLITQKLTIATLFEEFMALYTSSTPIRTISTSATTVSNSLSATSSVLVSANANRKGLTIFNSLSTTVYIDSDGSVSASAYMLAIPPGGYFEMPASDALYTGELSAILTSGTGSVQVREFV